MRRQPLTRPENVLALAVAEIERIKALLSRVTDGRSVVVETGTGPGDTTVPIETGTHTLYGVKHTRAFRVTDGGGLDVDYEQGQIWMGGSFYSVGAGSLTLDDDTTNYVFINSAGAAAYNATGFPADSVPLALVTTVAGDITALADRRSYLLPGASVIGSLHDADQIIDDDGDTSVEVEKNADEDIIRLTAATVEVATIGVAGQWQLPVVGAGAGILIGGDVQLYRSGANILRINDRVEIEDASFYFTLLAGDPIWNADANDYLHYARATNIWSFFIGGNVRLEITNTAINAVVGSITAGVDDTTTGVLTLYGPAAGDEGAEIQLYLSDAHDAVFDYWLIDIFEDDMRFFTSDAATVNVMTAEGQLQLPRQGASAGLLLGGDVLLYRSAANVLYIPDSVILTGTLTGAAATFSGLLQVGANDSALGRIILWGDGASQGGNLELYVGAAQDTTWNAWRMRILNDDDLTWYVVNPGGAATERMRLVAEGQLQIPTAGSGAGLLIGGDVQLYRSAANILYIPDSVAITGDLYFESDGSGLPYGHMHGYNIAETVAVAFAETWYELTAGLTGGETNLATFANNHELTVTKAGRYLITWSMSVQTGTAQDEIEGTVAVNNTANTTAAAHSTIVKANASITIAGTTILDLAASDDISLAVLNHTAARDVVVEHMTCSVVMAGGT